MDKHNCIKSNWKNSKENVLKQKEQMVQLEKILPDLERSIQALKRIDALNIQQKEIQEIIEKKGYRAISNTTANNSDRRTNAKKGFYICNPSTQNISDYPNTKNNCLSYKHMNSNILHGLKSKQNMKKQNKYLTLPLLSNRKKNISLHKNKSKYHTYKQLF